MPLDLPRLPPAQQAGEVEDKLVGHGAMSERLQREIEEILKQAGDLPAPPEKASRKGSPAPFSLRFRSLGQLVSPGRLFLGSVALLLSALLVSRLAPGMLVGLLFWMGLGLFIAAYALFFVRWSSRPELRWRGRPVDYGAPPPWWERLRRWLRR